MYIRKVQFTHNCSSRYELQRGLKGRVEGENKSSLIGRRKKSKEKKEEIFLHISNF